MFKFIPCYTDFNTMDYCYPFFLFTKQNDQTITSFYDIRSCSGSKTIENYSLKSKENTEHVGGEILGSARGINSYLFLP